MATRMEQLAALHKRLIEARYDAVDAFDAAAPGAETEAAMEREHRLNRTISIVKHAYKARAKKAAR